jgi:putative phosphoribosyl transferase
MIKEEINIPVGKEQLTGNLSIPEYPVGIVLFSHGSGSSRFSPRNQYVAQMFNQNQMATLLIDLLTPKEDEVDQYTREHRFNIPLLASRLELITEWLKKDKRTKPLKLAYIGSSTGAASALIAAAHRGQEIASVVSRGGRPDLAMEALPKVLSPTLFIIGGEDDVVIDLNKQAYAMLQCQKKMEIIPGATHLFEEPGTLEAASQKASQWLKTHFNV